MEYKSAYKVTYYVNNAWTTEKKMICFFDQDEATKVHKSFEIVARENNMFHQMPHIKKVLLMKHENEWFCIGSSIKVHKEFLIEKDKDAHDTQKTFSSIHH